MTITYPLPVSPLQLITSEPDFAAFAQRVGADVDAALRASATPDAARLKLLLGLQVHLALYRRDDPRALEAAERIRTLQTEPGERALAGLTTRALVSAKHDPGAFERDFVILLTALPRDAAVSGALLRAREKIAAISRDALLDDVRRNVEPRVSRGEPCTLEMADQIIRVRHRLSDILPLREAMLRAYDAALAAQK